MTTEPPAKSMSAARIGRERQDCQKCQHHDCGNRGGLCSPSCFKQFLPFAHPAHLACLEGGIRASGSQESVQAVSPRRRREGHPPPTNACSPPASPHLPLPHPLPPSAP